MLPNRGHLHFRVVASVSSYPFVCTNQSNSAQLAHPTRLFATRLPQNHFDIMPPRGGLKKTDLRACLICSILQSLADFVDTGCPNCEDVVEVSRAVRSPCHSRPYEPHAAGIDRKGIVSGDPMDVRELNIDQMQNNPERVNECTSVQWDGFIAMMQPTESWVARWQRIGELYHWSFKPT